MPSPSRHSSGLGPSLPWGLSLSTCWLSSGTIRLPLGRAAALSSLTHPQKRPRGPGQRGVPEAKVQTQQPVPSPSPVCKLGWQGQGPLLAQDREWYWLASRHTDAYSATMCPGLPQAPRHGVAEPISEVHSSPPMAVLPLPTCLFKHTWGHSPQSRREDCVCFHVQGSPDLGDCS